MEYVGNITIGTPGQPFHVLIDSGSANLYVPDSSCANQGQCSEPGCDQQGIVCEILCDQPTCCNDPNRIQNLASSPCGGKDMFYSNESSTYKYLKPAGSGTGFYGQDTVCFGAAGTQQLCVPKSTFGQQTSVQEVINVPGVDGVLGLGFQSIAADNVEPVFVNAINQGLVAQPIFTVYLEAVGDAANVPGGVITYGGLDTTNCGPVLAWQPLSSAGYFQFKMDSISLGSASLNNGWDVISDTGTSLIGGPQDITDALAKSAGAIYDPDQATYNINCDANQTLTIKIGGKSYQVTAKYLVMPIAKGECILDITPFDFGGIGPSLFLGGPFIRAYCHVYDIGQKRLGFANVIAK